MARDSRWVLVFPLVLSLLSIYGYWLSGLGVPLTREVYWAFVGLGAGVGIWGLVTKRWQLTAVLRQWWVLVPSLILWLMLWRGFVGYLTPPNNHDSSNHYWLLTRVWERQTLLGPEIYEGWVQNSWYMLGLHQILVFVPRLFNLSNPIETAFPIVWVLTALYPLAVYYLTLAVTERRPLSLVAALAAPLMTMFPVSVLGWGGWPLVMGVTLLFFGLGHYVVWLKRGTLSDFLWLIVILMGIGLIHLTELVWFGLLAWPLTLGRWDTLLKRLTDRNVWLIVVGAVLTLAPIVGGNVRLVTGPTNPTVFDHYAFGQLLGAWWIIQVSSNGGLFLTIFQVAGLMMLVKRRRHMGLVWSVILLYGLWVGRNSLAFLDGINSRLFPLFEPDRTYAILSGFLGIAAAVGIFELTGRLKGKRGKNTWLMAGGLVLLAGWGPWHKQVDNLRLFLEIDTTMAAQDIALWRRNEQRCGRYLNDGYADAGRFIPYFSASEIVLDGPLELVSFRDDVYGLMAGLHGGENNERLCQAQEEYDFDCVFVGGKDTRKERKRMDLVAMEQNPGLALIDREGESGVFGLRCN